MSDKRAVIFDYYETLAELSYVMRERTFDDLARSVGLDLPPGEAFRHWREHTTRDVVTRLGGQTRPPFDGEPWPFVSFRDVWRTRSAELFAYWGVEAPGDVGVQANVAAHAATGSRCFRTPTPSSWPGSMERNGLAFDLAVASDEVRLYKPHVSFFEQVCARLGVEPAQAVYVGDNPWADIAGARHAGLRAVWINRQSAVWPDDIEPPETEIASLDELPAALA